MSFINAQDFNEVNFADVELLFRNLIKNKNIFDNEFIQQAILNKIRNDDNTQTIYDTENQYINRRINDYGNFIYTTNNLNDLYSFIVLVAYACEIPNTSRASRSFNMLCKSLTAI